MTTTRNILIVGSGIVGTCLAHQFSLLPNVKISVLERDLGVPRGSTAFAPGFMGVYNDSSVLTELAKQSAVTYQRTGGAAFLRSGGLELATSEAGATEINRRAMNARAAGLRAAVIDSAMLPHTVTSFIDPAQVMSAAYFPDDASADVRLLTQNIRNVAISRGVRFLAEHNVIGIDQRGTLTSVTTAGGESHRCEVLVLAVGVWGASLARLVGLDLSIFAVSHPYVYSARNHTTLPGPFVRWPEHHVYARAHQDRLGIGSYDHVPIPVDSKELELGASLPWPAAFSDVIGTAQRRLRMDARFEATERVNGVFAMTPDNLPFLGRHPRVDGIWIAQALWVTHAAGAAVALVNTIDERGDLPKELAIDRFDGMEAADLRSAALRFYRDIYAIGCG